MALFEVQANRKRQSILSRACDLYAVGGYYIECRVTLDEGLEESLPVKFRPNINCSGGTTCLGVVVLVIDSFLGSMSGNRVNASSCDCML